MKKIITLAVALYILAVANNSVDAQTDWHITGNAGTNSNNFIGTTDNVGLKIKTNNATRMFITNGGKVGIGTTNPQEKLHVNGTGILARFGTGTTSATNNYCFIDNTLGTYIEHVGNTTSVGSDYLVLQTSKSGNKTDYSSFYIDPNRGFGFYSLANGNNNVGIGGFSPGYKFYVSSATPANSFVALIENTGDIAGQNGLLIRAGGINLTSANIIEFQRPNGVNIGEVVITASGVSYNTTSDKRLKNIIGTSQKGLVDLMKINIYDYTFKSDASKKVITGFMAQELYDVFPQSVSKPRDENIPAEKDPWTVDYGSVTPLIIKSVQELNEELKAEVRSQKSENEKLRNEIAEIKAALRLQTKSSDILPIAIGTTSDFLLEQNSPNPFTAQTEIKFRLPRKFNSTQLIISNADGKQVRSYSLEPSVPVIIKGSELAAGTYTYTLLVDGIITDTKQMVLTK